MTEYLYNAVAGFTVRNMTGSTFAELALLHLTGWLALRLLLLMRLVVMEMCAPYRLNTTLEAALADGTKALRAVCRTNFVLLRARLLFLS